MKKLFKICLIAICSLSFTAQSQVQVMTSPVTGAISDTVVNTATEYVFILSANVQDNVSVQPVITKISGTVAGTYFLQGSLDGTNYKSILGDSVTATNVTTNTKIWIESKKNYKYYRIGYTGTGTMSAIIKGYFFYNNPNK